MKPAGYTPRFAQLDKKVLRFFGVFEELLDPAVVGSAPAGLLIFYLRLREQAWVLQIFLRLIA